MTSIVAFCRYRPPCQDLADYIITAKHHSFTDSHPVPRSCTAIATTIWKHNHMHTTAIMGCPADKTEHSCQSCPEPANRERLIRTGLQAAAALKCQAVAPESQAARDRDLQELETWLLRHTCKDLLTLDLLAC